MQYLSDRLAGYYSKGKTFIFYSGLQFEFINPIFEFSKGMNDLHLDEAEYALLIAINIFSAGLTAIPSL